MKVIYPVLFYEEKEGLYSVFVPDLENAATCSSTLEEAMAMSEDLIAGIVLDIPKWVNTKAEELKINFSKTLEEALLQKIYKD